MGDPAGAAHHMLTVLPSAERTGPGVMALDLVRWLHRERPGWSHSTLFVGAGGDLDADFAAHGPTLVAGPDAPFREGRRGSRRPLNAVAHRRLRRRLAALGPIDLAHVHCAGSMRAHPALPAARTLLHVHELAVGLDLHLGPVARRHLGAADRYLAVSEAVGATLVDRCPTAAGRLDITSEMADPARSGGPADRDALGCAPDAVVVLMTGVRNWRKAPELFVRTALAARHAAPEMPWRFVWLGGAADGVEAAVAATGLDDLVTFLPHHHEVGPWLAAADVFLLTAREDAHPISVIEAALAGLPVVTFASGGAAEQVRASGGGVVVPFPDTAGAAAALVTLARDATHRAQVGRRGREHATAHLVTEAVAPQVLAALERTAAS